MLRLIILTIVAVLLAACGTNVSPAAPTKPCWDGSMARPCPPKPKPPEPTPEPEPEPTPPIVVVPEPPVVEPEPEPEPTPPIVEPEPEPTPPIVEPTPPSGTTLKAVQACSSNPYAVAFDSSNPPLPIFDKLVVGQSYTVVGLPALGPETTPTRYRAVWLPSRGVAVYYRESCFG